MTMLPWLRPFATRLRTRSIRKRLTRPRLSVETLEARWVPSTFTVLNTLDDTNPGSLRWAVAQANTTPGADTITFDTTAFSKAQTITLTAGQLELSDTATTTISGPAAGVTISGNNASRVFLIDGNASAALSGLTITGGNVGDNGGGLLDFGTLTMTSCTVSGNSAGGSGGGVDSYGTLTLTNCTLSGNSAGFSGGGVYSVVGTLTLTNCTVSGNSATVGNAGLGNSNASATLTNTIVAGNKGPRSDLGGGISGNNNLIGGDPLLAPLGNYGGPTQTMPVLPGSPAIDAGASGAGIPATDQRGLGPVGGVDIGAFQSQGFSLAAAPGSATQSSKIGTAFPAITAVVTANNPAEPVDGGLVTFSVTPAANGASAIFTNPSAVIANGQATFVAAPNNVPGNYTVVATSLNLSTSFAVSNTGKAFAALVVNSTSDAIAPGAGLLSLREAVAFANTAPAGNQTITFDPTVFATPTQQTITLSGLQLELSRTTGTVTIKGPVAGVTIAGGGVSRVFQVDAGVTASLSNLTLSGGSADMGGGLLNNGTATLTGCILSGNAATFGGGGGLLNNGTITLTGCTVSGNSSAGGFTPDGTYHTGRGGGLDNYGTATLTNCTVSGNSTKDAGGGVSTESSSTTTLTASTISGNSASTAGGGLANSGTTTLTSCTISGNSTPRFGGGLAIHGTVTLTSCTVSNNSAGFTGGGLYNFPDGTGTLTNTIVAGNTPNNLYGSFTGNNNLIQADPSQSIGLANGVNGNIVGTVDPLLAPLGNYGGPTQTMPLLPGSPAIDAGGSGAGIPTTDQRGSARLGGVDIGAFESQGFTLTTAAGSTPQSASIGTAFANPLAVTVTANNPAEPVNGGVVTFSVQPAAKGATAVGVATSVVVASGQASSFAAPNNVPGNYTVTASTTGTSASFALTNAGKAFAALVVNSTSDAMAPGAGLLSLREAIAFANTAPSGDQAITFDPSVFATPSPQTITLSGSQLELSGKTGSVTITGPAAGVTITAGGSSRVFQVDAGVTASLSNLTLGGGSADHGAGLLNNGTATLSNCTLSGNSASYGIGGGVFNQGTITLTSCTISGNSADVGGGLSNYGTATLTGCTLSTNSANYGPGGSLDNEGGTATLTSCTVSGNSSNAPGGGGFIYQGTVVLNGCTVSGNSAAGHYGRGGGLFISGQGTATLTGCTVSGNTAAGNGGGLSNAGTVTLSDCTISGNSMNPDPYAWTFNVRGGGLYNSGTATLTGCTVSGNSAPYGGGLSNTYRGGTATLTNCTVSGNSADRTGGGLDAAGTVTLSNCTVSANTDGSGLGGGLWIDRGTITLTNTIVAGNNTATSGLDLAGGVSGTNNLIGQGIEDGLVNGVDGNITGVNPLLAPLGNYGGPTQTMPLLPGSPAIDAGATGPGIPTTDERGLARVGGVDIGAFESQGFTLKTVAGSTPQTTNIGTAFARPLAVNVTAKNPVEPVDGGLVSFLARPGSKGASAIFLGNTAAIANGRASLTVAPNNVLGTYSVSASSSGVSAAFTLTNAGKAFASLVVNSTSDALAPGAGLLSLREAVAFANTAPSGSQSTITFDPTVFSKLKTITLGGSQLELSRRSGSVTITGPAAGVKITAGGSSRVLQVDLGVTASLSNLTLTGGSADHAAGLLNNGKTTLTGCTLNGNSAATHGGGLVNFGTATLSKCTVSGNTANWGGGGLINYGTATLTDSTVSGNSASYDGGLDNQGTAKLTNCTVSRNSASYVSGGLANATKGTLSLTGCTVSGNTAQGFGGGLTIAVGSTATLTNCSVSGNSAAGNGGGVLNAGTVTLTGSVLRSNSSGAAGGGLYTNPFGTATLSNCTVSGNSASQQGGGLFGAYHGSNAGMVKLTGCTVSGNSAGSSGGGVYNSGPMQASNCTINGNTAVGNGGGLCNAGTATLTGCTINGNSAGAGGGLFNQGTLKVAGGAIFNNTATSKGGGISTTGGSVTVTNAALHDNKVTSTDTAWGGAISSENSSLSLTGCKVYVNQVNAATAEGGGIFAQGGTVTVQGSTVNDNKALGTTLGQGGGVYGSGTVLNLLSSSVTRNKATTSFNDLFSGP